MSSILDVSATLGIMAVAVSLLMIGGEFDLSSGAATGTFAIITILLVKDVGDLGGADFGFEVRRSQDATVDDENIDAGRDESFLNEGVFFAFCIESACEANGAWHCVGSF